MRSDLTNIRLDNTKSQERLQTQLNSMIDQYQIYKLQMQPQAVYGSDISLSKATSVNIGLNILKFHIYVTSDLDPRASRLQTQKRFVTSLSCDL